MGPAYVPIALPSLHPCASVPSHRGSRKKRLHDFDPEITFNYLKWDKAFLLSQHTHCELYLYAWSEKAACTAFLGSEVLF